MVTISRDKFNKDLELFVTISQSTINQWSTACDKSNANNKYGVLSITKKISEPMEDVPSSKTSQVNKADNEDNQTVSLIGLITKIIRFDYHIIYSESYSVPVLYFKATYSDGSIMRLHEIWKLIPKVYVNKRQFSNLNCSEDINCDNFEEMASIVTQTEHPIFGTPYYSIHPCQTDKLLSNAFSSLQNSSSSSSSSSSVTSSSPSSQNIIITWLSSLGPLVGLSLDLLYAKALESRDCNTRFS